MRLRTGSRRRTPFWLFLPVLLLALLASLPLLYVAAKAWDAGWHSAWQLLWRPYVFRLLGNTLWLMFGVTLLSALLGLALAWCVERSDLPARRFWNVVLCLPFAIPAFVSSFTWVSLSPMYEGLGGAILVMTMSKYPLVYLPVAATLRGIDPSLEESARMLGLSRRQVFLRVTLPLLRPTLAATGLLVALHMLVEFGALSILRYQTFTTAIYQEFELEFSNATAAMLSSVLLALCFLLLWLELRMRGRGRLVRTGQGSAAGRTSPPGVRQVAAPGAAGDAGAGRYRYPPGDARLLAVRRLLGQLPADGNRLDPAFLPVAGLRRGPAQLPAGAARKHPGGALPRRPGALDPAPAVPAASVAGTGDRTLAGVLLAALPASHLPDHRLAAGRLCPAVHAADPGTDPRGPGKASPQLEEAARTLGQTPLMAFLRITLPIISPAIGAGFVLVFLDTMKELTATLVLGPTGLSTLATSVWVHTANLEYAAAAPYAALLILISGLPVYLLTTRAHLSTH